MNLKAWAFLAAAMIVFAWVTSPVRAVSDGMVVASQDEARTGL